MHVCCRDVIGPTEFKRTHNAHLVYMHFHAFNASMQACNLGLAALPLPWCLQVCTSAQKCCIYVMVSCCLHVHAIHCCALSVIAVHIHCSCHSYLQHQCQPFVGVANGSLALLQLATPPAHYTHVGWFMWALGQCEYTGGSCELGLNLLPSLPSWPRKSL